MGKISEALKEADTKLCVYQKIFLELSEEDMIAINEAVSKGHGPFIIANALREGGYQIAHSTVSAHLNKKCKCV